MTSHTLPRSPATATPISSQDRARGVAIGIMGTPLTSGNRGVQALGAALVQLCLSAGTSNSARIFGAHPNGTPITMRPGGQARAIPITFWRMTPRARLRDHLLVILAASFLYRLLPIKGFRTWIAAKVPWIGALEKTDLVGDVRGGDSFSDIYGIKRLAMASLPVLSVLLVKRNLVLFPQTYGPYKTRRARWIARQIIQRSSFVIARDKESQAIAQALCRPGQQVHYTPDVAFALFSDPMESAVFDDAASPQPIPTDAIGLNINGLMYYGGYSRNNMFGLKMNYATFLEQLIPALLARHPGTLILVPHTFAPAGDVESDNEVSRILKAGLPPQLQARVKIVTGDYDAHQLKGIIRRCRFFVGSRMHSCIAALSQGVPCVGVAYSMKFRGVFESVGMEDGVIDGRSTSNEDAIAGVLQKLGEGEGRAADLGARAAQARQALAGMFALIHQEAARASR